MSRKKTHEQFLLELHIVNPDVDILSEYIDCQTYVKCRCKLCGNTYNSTPSNLLAGYRCKICFGSVKKTQKEFEECVKKLFPNLEVRGEYKTARFKIPMHCNICGCDWEPKATHILSGHGCPKCSNRIKKTQEEYINELHLVNENIELVDNYIDMQTSIKHKCLVCGCVWSSKPTNLIHLHQGCPECNESHGEKDVAQYLKNHNINYIPQKKFTDCKYKRQLPFDFYLPTYNVCIEYDRKQHYEPIELFGGEDEFIIRQKRDSIKEQYCIENHIPLIRIRYDENIEDKLDDYLKQNKMTPKKGVTEINEYIS